MHQNYTVTYLEGATVQYAAGSWRTFDLPTMLLLPRTYEFRLDGTTDYITLSGADCHVHYPPLSKHFVQENGVIQQDVQDGDRSR